MNEDGASAHTAGSGQSVVTIINDPVAKWVVICILALAVGFCVAGVNSQDREISKMRGEVDWYRTEYRLTQQHLMDIQATLKAQGIDVPRGKEAKK